MFSIVVLQACVIVQWSILTVIGIDADGWADSDKQTILDRHNTYRSDVASGNLVGDVTSSTYPAASNMNDLF